MGYIAPVMIYCDALDQIEKNPEQFTAGVVDAIQRNFHGRVDHHGIDVPVGNHANPVRVLPSQHADTFRLLAVDGNTMVELTDETVVTELATGGKYVADWLDNMIARGKRALGRAKDQALSARIKATEK